MTNPNAGKKAFIPLNSSRSESSSKPAPVSPRVEKILSHVKETVKSADFRPSTSTPSEAQVVVLPRRRAEDSPPQKKNLKLKGIYFEKPVFDALIKMQEKDESVSQFVNMVVKANLEI